MQQNNETKQIHETMRQITNVITKSTKKALSEYCQIQNTNAKKINKHNLEMNATVCEYLNYSKHENLFLKKYSPQIVDMSDVFICTIFNL